jgi:hypothetical protein
MNWRWLPEDRAERIGLVVSAAGHALLILWALIGGIFFAPEENPATIATQVSLMSSEEFSALAARAPTAATDSPEQPAAPEASPKPPAKPEAEPPPEESVPTEPQPEPEPDAAPDVEDLAPVETEVTDAPPTETEVPTPDSLSQIPDTATLTPKPRPAPKVAPTPAEDPSPTADTSPVTEEQTVEAPAEEEPPQEVTEEAAPEEAGEVIETEENREEEVATAAPAESPRPQKRPEKPAEPAPDEVAAAEPAEETPPAEGEEGEAEAPAEDPLAAALEEAMAGEAAEAPAPGAGAADSGPPLTDGEKDALVVAVKECWNVGSLSTDALRTVVTVSVSMGQDGRPDSGSIRMIGFEGGDETAARQAFEAGRRAIMRCGRNGYPLPAEKYAQWKEIEIVFNPEKMRLR